MSYDTYFFTITFLFVLVSTILITFIVTTMNSIEKPKFIKTDPPPINWNKVNV